MSEEVQVKVSQAIIDYARDAKSFIRESGEDALPDELLMRASVAFNMLQSRRMITEIRTDQGCKPHPFDGFDRAFAIALIAHNFDDHPPNTPEREVLFGAKLAALASDRHEHAGREKKLEVALRNCLAMAVRMQRRGVPRHHEQVSIPGDPWTDIVRFCAEAGVVPNILREADDAG